MISLAESQNHQRAAAFECCSTCVSLEQSLQATIPDFSLRRLWRFFAKTSPVFARAYFERQPPSTRRTVPVIKLAASDARKSTGSAISSG